MELVASATSVLPFSALGLGRDTPDFQIGPIIDGIPTHVPELLSRFIVLAIVVRIVARLIDAIVAPGLRWALRMIAHGAGRRRNGDASASREPAHAGRECTSTGFYLWSTIAIPGVIFVLTTNVYFYHYYFVLCPFLFVLVRGVHASVAPRPLGSGDRPGPDELCLPELRPPEGRDRPRGVWLELRSSREPLKPAAGKGQEPLLIDLLQQRLQTSLRP